MTAADIDTKSMIAEQIKKLEQDWHAEVDNETRQQPVDYIRIGEIQGGINALMNLLVLVDGGGR